MPVQAAGAGVIQLTLAQGPGRSYDFGVGGLGVFGFLPAEPGHSSAIEIIRELQLRHRR